MPTRGLFFCIAALFATLRAEAQPGPRILHDGLNCVLAGQHLILQALIEPIDELTTVKAYFRANLYNQFYYVEMVRAGDHFEGVLPKPSDEITGLHYYLEAVDTSFNSARTAEFTPQVVTSAGSCREDNPTPAVYLDGPGAITIGSTGPGPGIPTGFLPEGIVGTLGTLARSGGGGSGLFIGAGAAAGAAAGIGILVTGNDGEVPPNVTSTPVTTSAPPATTSLPPASTTIPTTGVMACFSTSPSPPRIPVGGSVRFDASCTEPARELIATYSWNFNDGRSGREGRVVNRSYNSAGIFGAVLTVTTLDGATGTAEMDVVVDEDLPPPPPPGGGGRIVRITKSGPGSASIGTPFNYTINITNTGATPATGITMSDPIPAGLTLGPVTFSPTVDGCGGGAVVTCTIAALAPGAVGTITIQVTPTPATPSSVTNTANLNVTSPPESGSNRHRLSVSLKAPPGAPTRVTTRFTSHLALPPGDGATRTQLTFNEARTVVTDNSGPSSHDVPGRTGDNLVDGILLSNPTAEGVWRFDFRGAPGFEPGSLTVETGSVVSTGPREIVFRVAPGVRRIKFRYRLSAGAP